MPITLTQYLQKVRFYLRDYYAVAYQQQDLIDCINQARANIVSDSFVNRALVTGLYTTANQYTYTYAQVLQQLQTQIPLASSVVFINSIAVYWSATLKPTLDYMEWTDLNAIFLSFLSFTFIPSVWGEYAPLTSFVLAPIPNAAYQLEVDCCYLPNTLVNPNDTDLLPATIADLELVPFEACRLAKIHQNSHGESMRFDALYQRAFERRFSGYPSHRVASRYGTDVRSP